MPVHRFRLLAACGALACLPGGAAADETVVSSLGNRVFLDDNANGRLDLGERGAAGWAVRLIAADGLSTVATTATSGSGHYRFDALAAGTYLVEVSLPSGYRSSPDLASTPEPADGTDSDDNGLGDGTGSVRSGPVILGTQPAPTGEADVADDGQGAADERADMTVDFAITRVAVIPIFIIVPPVTPPPAPQSPQASVSVSASAPARATPGQIVEYRITVRNTARVAARDVVLVARPPAGTSTVETVHVEQARTRQTLRIGTLPARSARRLRVRVRFIRARVGTRLTLDAAVSSSNAKPVAAAASVRVVRGATPGGEL